MKLVRMSIVASLVAMLLFIVLASCVRIDTLHDKLRNPSPADGAVGVPITPILKWETKYKWPFEVGEGTVTGNTYIYSPDYNASGTYKVVIKAADSISEATDDFIITVKNVNRAPVLNISDQTISEGATLT